MAVDTLSCDCGITDTGVAQEPRAGALRDLASGVRKVPDSIFLTGLYGEPFGKAARRPAD
jgi:hypothetical protein